MRKEFAAAIFLLLAALFTACRTGGEPPPEAEPSYPVQSVELIAPAGTGSGYDVTIRSVAQCLADTRLVSVPLPVTNKPGSGGGVALSYLSENPGRDDILSVFSPPLCLINLNGSTYLEIKAKIETDLLSGRILPGQKLPTIRLLAERYRANGGTVLRALLELRETGLVTGRRERAAVLTRKCIRQLKDLGCTSEEIKAIVFANV